MFRHFPVIDLPPPPPNPRAQPRARKLRTPIPVPPAEDYHVPQYSLRQRQYDLIPERDVRHLPVVARAGDGGKVGLLEAHIG